LISGIASQVDKLLIQIQTLKTEQTNLNLQGLKTQIDALMAQLRAAYAEYNTCVGSTKDLEAKLVKLRKEQKALEARI
jgi:hypothetical protein